MSGYVNNWRIEAVPAERSYGGPWFRERSEAPEYKRQIEKELEWVAAARTAVRAGSSAYAALLNDQSPELRVLAALLLGSFHEDGAENFARLKAHLERETDEIVRTACVLAIGVATMPSGVADSWLENIVDSTQPLSLRVAASLGLCWSIRRQPSAAARKILADAEADPGAVGEVFERLHWGCDLKTCCREALVRTAPQSPALPGLIKSLDEVSPAQSWEVVRAMLTLVFHGKPMPPSAIAEDLEEDQLRALRAIASSSKLWVGFPKGPVFVDAVKLLRAFGLPYIPEKIQAFLDGKLISRDPS